MAEDKPIEITLNGKPYTAHPPITVRILLEQLAMGLDYIAVELNNTIVRRKDWEQTMLQPGDKIEIVRLVGGGLGGNL